MDSRINRNLRGRTAGGRDAKSSQAAHYDSTGDVESEDLSTVKGPHGSEVPHPRLRILIWELGMPPSRLLLRVDICILVQIQALAEKTPGRPQGCGGRVDPEEERLEDRQRSRPSARGGAREEKPMGISFKEPSLLTGLCGQFPWWPLGALQLPSDNKIEPLVAQKVQNLPVMQETQVQSLGGKILWRKEWLLASVFLP